MFLCIFKKFYLPHQTLWFHRHLALDEFKCFKSVKEKRGFDISDMWTGQNSWQFWSLGNKPSSEVDNVISLV